MIVNRDSFLGGNHNFFLYLDPKDDRIRFIPWDQDLSMGSRPFGRGDALTPFDVMRPIRGDQPLILLAPRRPRACRAIPRHRQGDRDVGVHGGGVLKLVDALEKVGTGRGPSPREFITTRTAYVQQLIAGLPGR